jgi:hypothetical protein
MKEIIFTLLGSLLLIACNGQEKAMNEATYPIEVSIVSKSDTISVYNLANKQYGNDKYVILKLYDTDSNGHWTKSRWLELVKNDKRIAKIPMPESNYELKNFKIVKIDNTTNGFCLSINWGGGNNIYDIFYYFIFINGDFYLQNIRKIHHFDNGIDGYNEETKVKTISSQIRFSEFRITDYLD